MKHTRGLALLMALMLLFTMIPAVYAEATNDEEEGGVATSMVEEEGDLSSDEAAAAAGVEMTPFVPENTVEKAIIGADNRVTVNPSVYPYCAIAYLKVTAECGCSWTASGFMVGPQAMMTGAHCVVCTDHGKGAKKITAYFGYKSNSNYLYKYTGGFTYWYNSSYTSEHSSNWDYAYIKLNERMGDKVGWFGMNPMSDSELNFSAFEVAGYRDGVLKAGWGISSVQNEYTITYDNDTQPGYSGCPVFTDDYYVVAINVAHKIDGSKNVGRRITGTLIRNMRNNGVID